MLTVISTPLKITLFVRSPIISSLTIALRRRKEIMVSVSPSISIAHLCSTCTGNVDTVAHHDHDHTAYIYCRDHPWLSTAPDVPFLLLSSCSSHVESQPPWPPTHKLPFNPQFSILDSRFSILNSRFSILNSQFCLSIIKKRPAQLKKNWVRTLPFEGYLPTR